MNEVRIISGKWKRRKLAFPDRPTLRPTPDRARETVFNWLAPWIDGARCLDLFAGSGALGFESLSRGAAAATLVDVDPIVIRALQASARMLDAADCTIRKSAALEFLRSDESVWDIVFLDPPFASRLLEQCLCVLQEGGPHLHQESIVYVESSIHHPLELSRWRIIKTTRTGDVQAALLMRSV